MSLLVQACEMLVPPYADGENFVVKVTCEIVAQSWAVLEF